ncbi:MAG TPA: FtsX-like permease family protein [Vicinamibacterales bacterium]
MLVSAQIALAFLLVVGAGLLTRTMSRLAATQLGFNPEHLSFVAVSFPASRYLDSAQHAFPLGEDVLSRIRAIHGVMAASPVIIPPPLSPIGASVWRWHFVPVGARDIGEQGVAIPMEVGDSALFTTLGVRVVRGRAFTADDRDGSGAVVVVSESAANELWPGQDPIGRQLRILEGGGLPSGAGARTVVGVVHDLHYREFDVSSPTVFLPWRQAMWQGWLAIRTSGPLAAVLPDIRAAVAGLGPDINASQAQSMDELLATPLAVPRLGAFLLSAFGSVALLIAAIGLYAVIATAVRHRRHEIGVRLALGATAHAIRRQVVLDAMRIVAVGAFVGVGASLVMSRFATSLLHDVSPFDPLAFLGALVLLCAVAWAAAFVPAFRVARIDPTTVLRQE